MSIEESIDRLVPPHMLAAVRGYVFRGEPCGGFLKAVFANNLLAASIRADDTNRGCLWKYGKLLYLLPSECWGSPAAVTKWIKTNGLTSRTIKETTNV